MKTNNIEVLPSPLELTPEQALGQVGNHLAAGHVSEVIIIYKDADGDTYSLSSTMTRETANWMIDIAKKYVFE